MSSGNLSLNFVFEGWDSYQTSLVRAISPLAPDELAWRPAPNLRSVGEIACHISFGRIDWFSRMDAPGSAELAKQTSALKSRSAIAQNQLELLWWLEASWQLIEDTLSQWTVLDLDQTYRHVYQRKTYAISRQWTIWRVLSHDIHHGGQLAIMLGIMGIPIPDLGDQGGHLIEPPLAEGD